MIKEITQTIRDSSHFVGAVMQESEDNITAQMKVFEADEFVDDDFNAEIVLLTKLVETCEESDNVHTGMRRAVPEGTSKAEYYNNIVEDSKLLADATIFKNTKRFRPNYVLISGDLLPIFTFNNNFNLESNPVISGAYTAGTYKNIPVLVTPVLDKGQMIWGVNEANASGIYTFVNDEGKICNKIVSPNYFAMINLED